jgi:hypothetical protein
LNSKKLIQKVNSKKGFRKKMSNQNEDVDVCGICSKVFVDPRLLPCGETACHECIQNVIQSDPMKKEFICKFCKGRHESPPGNQGFYVNLAISKLIKANADKMNEFTSVKKLREKLAEIKVKCEEFELNLDNGVDQLREHCIRIRNQVHLRTDRLIEEVHNFNESLIAEINKYEQECVESFDKQMKGKSDQLDSFVSELNEFCTNQTNYLNEFKIKEKVVEEAVAKADGHLKRLKVENRGFKTMVFNGKIIELKNFHFAIGSDFIGSFEFKNVGIGSNNSFRDQNLSPFIFKNYKTSLFLFMNKCGTNFCFYISHENHLTAVSFNIDDKKITQVPNVLESINPACSLISSFQVAESGDKFIIHVKFLNASGFRVIRGHTLGTVNNCPCLVFMLDKNLEYSKHSFNIYAEDICHMAANDSSILMVSRSNEYQNLNMNLDPIIKRSWKSVKAQVGKTIIGAQMNDKYVFFLCDCRKLKIIEINSGELVHEIETSADQIKLASTDYLVLFSQIDRITHVYEQAGEFRKLDEIPFGIPFKFNGPVLITRDKLNSFALYDLISLRFMSLD